MKKNYLKQFNKYIKKVYCIEEYFEDLKDGRKDPRYTTAEVSFIVFMGFIMRIQSFNDLKYRVMNLKN